MAKESKRSRLEEKLDAWDADYVKQGKPPAPSLWSGDPVENLVNRGAAMLPEGFPPWLRTVGRLVIPQNTPEAVLTAATLPWGGLAAARALPLAGKLAQKGIGMGLTRAGLTGLATGAAGALTGHDPLQSGLLGAGGRIAGETLGVGGGKLAQRAASSRLFSDASGKVVQVFRDTIGDYLPKDATTDAAVLRAVIRDDPSKQVGLAINEAKARLAKKPIQALDLKPVADANGIVYAWPTEAGGFPKSVGPGAPTVQGGTVWPRPRTFESKLTPGEGLAPYGAMESSPRRIGAGEAGGALEPTEVPFGELWDKVDEVYQATELAVRDGNTDLVPRLEALKQMRETLVDRTQDPDLKKYFKDYGVTKALRDLFWGKRKAPAAYGEDVVKDLIDEETGELTQQGVKVVFDRLNTDAPNIARTIGDDTTRKLAGAVGLQPEKGLASPVPGQWPQARFHPGVGGVHPTIGLEGTRVSNYPGWQAERSMVEKLLPEAMKVLTAPAPLKVAGADAPPAAAEEAPDLEAGASIAPGKLRDPYAVDVGAPKGPALTVDVPAPPKLPSPEASSPEAGAQGAGWFPRFDDAEADQPEVFLETTKKPGE